MSRDSMRLSLTEMVNTSLQITHRDPLFTHQQLPRFGLNSSLPLASSFSGADTSPTLRYKASKCPQSPEETKVRRRQRRGNTAEGLKNRRRQAGDSPLYASLICTRGSLDLQSLKESLRLEPRCEDCRSAICRCAKTVKDADLRRIQQIIKRRKARSTLWGDTQPLHPSSNVQTAASSFRHIHSPYKPPPLSLYPRKRLTPPSPLLAALRTYRAEMAKRTAHPKERKN